MSIDLHIHSVNSDGTSSVEEIVNLSKELQLEAISITDHEYLTEVPSDNDIKIIKGIEVGADWKELKSKNPFAGIHLLVYFLDRNTSLNARLEEIRNKKKDHTQNGQWNQKSNDANIIYINDDDRVCEDQTACQNRWSRTVRLQQGSRYPSD